MAVIREQKQFKIGPVGVNRSSRGGQIIGEAIASSAAGLEQQFLSLAVDKAKQRGAESAQALEREQIIALNEDGRPEAYKIPSLFGKIEREAYNAVLMQRFETEINLDMEDRSKELAIQFRKNPEGYKQAMFDYIAAMANTEKSTVYTNYIRTLGEGLTMAKYRGLQLQAIQRQEAADRAAYAKAVDQNKKDIYDVASVGGDVSELIQSGKDLDTINVRSKTTSANSISKNDESRSIAHVSGTINYEVKKALNEKSATKEDFARLKSALDLGDPSLIPDAFPNTKALLSGKKASFLGKISEFGAEVAQDGVVQKELDNAAFIRQEQFKSKQTIAEANKDFGDMLRDTPEGVVSSLDDMIDLFKFQQNKADLDILNGIDPNVANTQTFDSKYLLSQSADTIINKLMLGADGEEELINIQQYLKSQTLEDRDRLTPEATVLADGLLKLKEVFPDIVDKADKFAESISDETRFREAKEKLNNDIAAYDMFDEFQSNAFSSNNVDDLESAVKLAVSHISKENINDTTRKQLSGMISDAAGRNYLRLAFSGAKTSRLINAMSSYINTGTDQFNILSEEQRGLLDKGRESFRNPSTLSSALSKYRDTAERDLKQRAEDVKVVNFVKNVQTGTVDGSLKENREMLDNVYGVVPEDFLDPERLKNNPNLAAALAQASSVIWPEAQIKAYDLVLSGRVTGDSLLFALTTFDQSSKFITSDSQTMQSHGSQAMSKEDFALMVTLNAYRKAGMSPEQILQHMSNMQSLQQNPELQKAMDDMFTRKQTGYKGILGTRADIKSTSLETYIAQKYPDTITNTNLRNQMVALAQAAYFENASDTATGFNNIDKVLDDAYENSYVKDDMIIAEDGSSKTIYPLELTTGGYHEEFKEYIRNEMAKNRVNDDVDWLNVDFKLVPVGSNYEDSGMTYGVILYNKETGERKMQDVRIPVDPRDGEAEDFMVFPAFFSTNEPAFAKIKQGIREEAIETELTEAERRSDFLEEMKKNLDNATTSTVGGVVIPDESMLQEIQQATEERGKNPFQDAVAPLMDVNKYSSFLDRLDPALARRYKELPQASEAEILKDLATLNGRLQNSTSEIGNELKADIIEMMRQINVVRKGWAE